MARIPSKPNRPTPTPAPAPAPAHPPVAPPGGGEHPEGGPGGIPILDKGGSSPIRENAPPATGEHPAETHHSGVHVAQPHPGPAGAGPTHGMAGEAPHASKHAGARAAPTGVEYGEVPADSDMEKRILTDAGFSEYCAAELVERLPGAARILWELCLVWPYLESPPE